MLALTFFWNFSQGGLFPALLKGLLLFVILAGAVLLTAWLGAAVFAAVGLVTGKAVTVVGLFTALAKLGITAGGLI